MAEQDETLQSMLLSPTHQGPCLSELPDKSRYSHLLLLEGVAIIGLQVCGVVRVVQRAMGRFPQLSESGFCVDHTAGTTPRVAVHTT